MPWAPRWSSPPEMSPAPMPVLTLMKTRSSTSGRWACCSPSAMMFTSLSMSTGTSKARCTWAGTSYRSQPGMIGGLIARPVECSTGPGRPMPIAASSPTSRRWSASISAITDSTQPSTCSGPVATSRSSRRSTSTVPARSASAAVACVAPMSTPATTQAPGFSASSEGGRPPVDTPPYGITRPRRSSESIRAAMVDRASPVSSASWARVRGCPSRNSSKRSLARTSGSQPRRTSARPAKNFYRMLDRST